MCLISRTVIPSIAQEDIVCYKVLERNTFFYRTPYVGDIVFPFILKVLNIPFKAKGPERIEPYGRELWTIDRGFIHSYKTKKPNYARTIRGKRAVYFECTIPKGSEYFEDINNNEYASKQIKFIKRVRQ